MLFNGMFSLFSGGAKHHSSRYLKLGILRNLGNSIALAGKVLDWLIVGSFVPRKGYEALATS